MLMAWETHIVYPVLLLWGCVCNLVLGLFSQRYHNVILFRSRSNFRKEQSPDSRRRYNYITKLIQHEGSCWDSTRGQIISTFMRYLYEYIKYIKSNWSLKLYESSILGNSKVIIRFIIFDVSCTLIYQFLKTEPNLAHSLSYLSWFSPGCYFSPATSDKSFLLFILYFLNGACLFKTLKKLYK